LPYNNLRSIQCEFSQDSWPSNKDDDIAVVTPVIRPSTEVMVLFLQALAALCFSVPVVFAHV
jgi:hypothetical protein